MTTELSVSKIAESIYFIRGHHVMLDSDLAVLYEVETRVLNQVVRRNEKRFQGDDFHFRLNGEEYNSLRSQTVILENNQKPLKSGSYQTEGFLRSQNVILETGKGKHRKFLPTAFTEYGALMLSTFVEFRRKLNMGPSLEEQMQNLARKVDQFDQKYDRQTQTLLNAIQQIKPSSSLSLPQLSAVAPPLVEAQTQKKISDHVVLGKRNANMVETIQKEVAHYFGLKVPDLKSSKRVRTISLPRQIAIYLIRKHTQLGFQEIGKIFGGKDHTTVMHAFQKITHSVKQDEIIQESVRAIEAMLRT